MIQDVSINRDNLISHLKANLNVLAATCVPEIFKFLYPPVFLAIWQLLTTAVESVRGKYHLCIGIPRGFGKTVFLKIYVVYLVLFTDRKFILIVCNTQDLAENFISDVWDVLTGTNIRAIFGDIRAGMEKDTQKLKKTTFRGRNLIIAGLGAGTSLRGLNVKYVRPDVILMDDMQSKEQAESAIESAKILSWMVGTLMKAAAPERCVYIFVGNMYPYEGSILRKLKRNKVWISFIAGAILEDGESIWPELKPVEEIIQEFENDDSLGQSDVFFAEVMNDEEAGSKAGIDISQIKTLYDDELPPIWDAGFVVIDPAVGKKKNDDIAMTAVLIFQGQPVVKEILHGKFTPKETIIKAVNLAIKYNLPVIAVESVAYQATLVFWFTEYLNRLGIQGIEAVEIYPGANSKNARIIAMLKQLISGEIKLAYSIRNVVVNQISHFNPLRADNRDDILDTISAIYNVISTYRQKLLCVLNFAVTEKPAQATHGADMELDF